MTTQLYWLHEAAAAAAAGQVDRAISAYSEALSLAPGRSDVHYNLGALLASKQQYPAAERAFEEAQRLRPDWPAASLALGHVCYRQSRYADAEHHFHRAATLAPDSIEALGNLALTLNARNRHDLSLPYLRRARAVAPSDEDVWFTLRASLVSQGLEQEALDDFLAFERMAKPSARLVTAGVEAAMLLGDDVQLAKYRQLAVEWPYAPAEAHLVAALIARMQYLDVARETLASFYRTYDRLQQINRGGLLPLAPRPRADDGVLRVGYLSADFRAHVMGHVLMEIIERHDRRSFSIHAYSLATSENEDAMTERFQCAVDGFVRLAEMDDLAAARRIAADDLDVLIDLMAHSSSARPTILLYKPAPVIVTHLGHHGCVGLRQVDFKLTDRDADLPDAAEFQIEQPLRMETCVLPLRRVTPDGALPTRDQLGIAHDAIVFGAFVGLVKLSSRCLGLWREILDRVAGSRLAFSPYKETERPMLLRRLARAGISAERVVFLPMTWDEPKDRTRYAVIDVVLDTCPYTGGDTSAAALDMGIPVVTRCGDRQAERMTFSILAHLGITTTVARTDADYIAIACRLATDQAWRADVAATIRQRVAATPLADLSHYTRSLEDALRRAVVRSRERSRTPERGESARRHPDDRSATSDLSTRHAAIPIANRSPTLEIVSATRLPEHDFWSESALGVSLRRIGNDSRLVARVTFANRRGIPDIYNARIAADDQSDIVIFIHDDVWIDDDYFADRVIEGLTRYDLIGVAGSRRRVERQPAWSFPDTRFVWDDRANLSGSIAHGKSPFGQVSSYGAAPADCELLDGVFLAARKAVLRTTGVRFDPQFEFHFYDMDICRSARQRGLRLGTWPISLTHQSLGAYDTEQWNVKYRAYLDKWRT